MYGSMFNESPSVTSNLPKSSYVSKRSKKQHSCRSSNTVVKRSAISLPTTMKPSFFCHSLEAFSKHSLHRKTTRLNRNEIADLTDLNLYDDYFEPNLLNWEKWLKIHKKLQDNLCRRLERPQQCMLMNTSSDTLYTNQEKKLITEASNLELPDKFRGHPSFWKSDDHMNIDGKPCGVYQTVQQKYDRSRQNYFPQLPEREYVGIPEQIYKEKGLGRKPCLLKPKEKWESSPVVAEKRNLLETKLKILEQYKPDVEGLAVVGKQIPMNRMVLSSYHKHELTSSKDDSGGSSLEFEPVLINKRKSAASIAVESKGGESIVSEKDPNLWTVQFENCLINEKYKTSLVLRNLEDSALKYSWEMVLPNWADSRLPLKLTKSKSKFFFFDKNDNAILPGCGKELVFYFKAPVVGVFCEKWRIMVSHSPDDWETRTVELQAVAVEKVETIENLYIIDSYVESCTKYTLAKKTVSEILGRSRPEKPEQLPYNWNFFQEELFVHNNPDLFYDSKKVLVLEELHKEFVKGPWDYSVKNLRGNLLQKALTRDMSKELDLFTSTVYQLMKPNIPVSLVNEKHKTVYELLCSFVNKMEYESKLLRLVFNIPAKVRSSDEVEIRGVEYSKSSVGSGKVSIKASQISKKSSGKVASSKSISGKKFSPKSPVKFSRNSVFVDERDSNIIKHQSSNEIILLNKKKQEYLEALYTKTYTHLCHTVDHISAVIDSFDAQKVRNFMIALKEKNF